MSPRRFQDKLKKIRDASAQRSVVSLRLRSEVDLVRSQRRVRGFEFREKVEAVIEDFSTKFGAEAPGFVLTRGFYEGKYMLALRLDEELVDEEGAADRYFSRLMWLLDPDTEGGTFAILCRRTIRNHDMETASHEDRMVDDSLPAIAKFIEAQYLEYAERYFAETTLSRSNAVETSGPS